jgi:viologen exporter family transport system ATP-binding protein
MRGDLASALLHYPEILYLDEPTIGLDVAVKQRIGDFLGHLNQERTLTVLLTTHDMTDSAQLCQRMLLIDHGRLRYDGAAAAIRDRFGVERILGVDLAKDETPDGPLNAGPAMQVRANGPRRWLRFRRDETTAAE